MVFRAVCILSIFAWCAVAMREGGSILSISNAEGTLTFNDTEKMPQGRLALGTNTTTLLLTF